MRGDDDSRERDPAEPDSPDHDSPDRGSVSGNPMGDEFDRLLVQARWPEPSDAQLARLESYWRQVRSKQLPRRRRAMRLVGLVTGALAASVLVVATWASWRPEWGREIAPLEISAPQTQAVVSSSDAVHDQRPIVVREPTPYERVLLADAFHLQSARGDSSRHRVSAQSRKPRRWEEAVLSAVQLLGQDPQAEPSACLPDWSRGRGNVERYLWRMVPQATAADRLGATRLLAAVGTRQSVSVLFALSAEPELQESALLGLARLATDAELRQMAGTEVDSPHRQRIIAALVGRHTPSAVSEFLVCVSDERLRADALAALGHVNTPPIELMAVGLRHPEVAVRLASAGALASLNDPRAANCLYAALAGVGRQEALLGLLASSSARAEELIRAAEQDAYLVASVQVAEARLRALRSGIDEITASRGGALP